MDIVIGRESGAAEPRLCLKTGNTTKFIGAAGSVPRSVSRSHCVISIDGNNKLTINNVSDQNALYVNGMEYKSKSILETDLVELGPEKYRLDIASVIKALRSPAPTGSSATKSYNISSLRRIWNDYTQAKLDIQIRERKIGVLSVIPGLVSMISIALAFIPGVRGIFFTIAIIGSILFIVIRFKYAANVPRMQKELEDKFQDTYICPHCSHFFGNQSYKLILRNGGCPWCKSKFTE